MQVIKTRKRMLKQKLSDTLISINNLAHTYEFQDYINKESY